MRAVGTLPAELHALLSAFAAGPARLRQAVDGLNASALGARARGDDWTVRDILVHIGDMELVRAVRVRRMLAEMNPLLLEADESLWKRRLQYLWRDPAAALAAFELNTFQTAEILRHTSAEGWARTGNHSARGVVTVRDVIQWGVTHVDDHLPQIAAARASVRR